MATIHTCDASIEVGSVDEIVHVTTYDIERRMEMNLSPSEARKISRELAQHANKAEGDRAWHAQESHDTERRRRERRR